MSEKKYEPLTKCLCTNTFINYIKDQGWSTEGIFEGIAYGEEFMCDIENWMPTDQIYKLCKNITAKFPQDPELFYKMALWGAEKKTVGALQTLARSLLQPGLIYDRLPKYIENLNKHRKIDILKRTKDTAIINTYHMTEVRAIKEVCAWTRGLLAVAPYVLGLPPAEVKETLCELKGDKCCQYEVNWINRKNIFSRIWEIAIGQKSVIEDQRQALEQNQQKLLERFEELKKAKEIIEEYAGTLEIKVEERTRELREAQAKLVETEKRVLEHRITGGFAHEMRNALTGAQLEMKAVLDYQEKGKAATEVIKEAATNLLQKIKTLQAEYQIPKDLIAQTLIPSIKEIAQVIEFLAGTHQDVYHDLERGLSITSQIRDYAKMAELRSGNDPVDLAALLKGYETRYAKDFGDQKIRYSFSGPDSLILKGDETHFNSIFTNLILNARDALLEIEKDDKQIHVSIETTEKDGNPQIRIKVWDNGPGIPENHLSEIFEPFFSTKPSSGTGLGLGIVKRLVQLYGGNIEVESQERPGACFTVTL
jgi:signal transduction histidine kinase